MKNLKIKLVDDGICEFYIEDELVFKKKLPIDTWSLEDFQKQWNEGLQRIKTHNESMLVVWVSKLDKNPDIYCFSLYKVGDKIHILEWGISGKRDYGYLSRRLGPFTRENCYKYIDPYDREYIHYIVDI